MKCFLVSARRIAYSDLPFTLVEDPFFRSAVQQLNPAFRLPGRNELSKRILDRNSDKVCYLVLPYC